MDKFKRNERIASILYILTTNPSKVFTYNHFTDMFNAAKSTISEDIIVAKDLVEKLKIGYIKTISGAAGGVIYLPNISKEEEEEFLSSICEKISENDRMMPGGFIFMMDLLYSPEIAKKIGKIFASKFISQEIEYVVTIETKGIPIALMTAQILNVPLVIVRKDAKITEGATVSINYISASTKKIETMSLSKRAMKEGARVLIIDDFMKGGGTAKGMVDMMKEFKAEVKGVGVFISTRTPENKLIDDFISLLVLEELDENEGKLIIKPNLEKIY
ncbi:Pur operon repressor [Gottschalkia purinilytica]|uniref:Pur operon repressor n=1 Tax=Gottschalkia purinilytica TaxID=1503 RepID=A0A0L0W915_GOTPU|nr:pur operon repressor [Gottschalkia purinilytica]KNF07800.1 Pur operon repressor [Gottschalkia purinilytica]